MVDVAERAQVSLSTVSRVVNGDPTVSSDLRARVEAAIDATGYRPNTAAAALRRDPKMAAHAIGVIVEDAANPFFSAIQRGIEEIAYARDVLTLTGSTDGDPERERKLIQAFVRWGVDGLVVVPAVGDRLTWANHAPVPVVCVDRPDGSIKGDTVTVANREGARMAVHHLHAFEHRRIAFVGDRPEIFTAHERLLGYRMAIEELGLERDQSLIWSMSTLDADEAYGATRALLAGPRAPTAIFSAQNLVTIEVTRALHDMRLQDRVAFVGFDDVVMARMVRPGLTVIKQDPGAIGAVAADLLFERVGGNVRRPGQIELKVELKQRGSGEILAPQR